MPVNITEKLELLKIQLMSLELESKKDVTLENRKIDECLVSQLQLQLKWNKILARANRLVKLAENNEEEHFSIAYRDTKEFSSHTLTATDVKHIAGSDLDYIAARNLSTDVIYIKNKIQAYTDTIESRKYILKDLTNLIINGAEKYIL